MAGVGIQAERNVGHNNNVICIKEEHENTKSIIIQVKEIIWGAIFGRGLSLPRRNREIFE